MDYFSTVTLESLIRELLGAIFLVPHYGLRYGAGPGQDLPHTACLWTCQWKFIVTKAYLSRVIYAALNIHHRFVTLYINDQSRGSTNLVPIVTGILRNAGHGKSRASHEPAANVIITAVVNKNAEKQTRRQDCTRMLSHATRFLSCQ